MTERATDPPGGNGRPPRAAGRGARGDGRRARDPYDAAPSGELSEPLLPRWFVVLAVLLVPVAAGVFLIAFPLAGDDEPVPVAERRPPPDGALSHDVGEVELGPGEPQPADPACTAVDGFAVAGTEQERLRLEAALDALCDVGAPGDAGPALAALRDAGAVVRFAAFERTGVDSALDGSADPPAVLVNVRFTRVEAPRWVTPLVVHDAVVFTGEAGTVETALAARRAELATCEALFESEGLPRGCESAAELLALEDPAAALRDAGYE